MWALSRAAALLVLAIVAVLLAGRGMWLLDLVDRAVATGGAGPLPRGGAGPGWPTVGVGLVAGAAAAIVRPVRTLVGQIVTLLHELGHTLTAAALGARPAGIVLRHDASGHATARWLERAGWGRRVSLALTAFAGLPAPAAAAGAGAGLLAAAGPRAVLWALVAAGVVVAVLARSPWTLLVPAGLAGLAVVALSDPAQPWAAGVTVALLAAVATRSTAEAAGRLRRPITAGDDARAVHRQLRLPPRLVQVGQLAATGAAGARTVWSLLSVAGIDVAGALG